MSYLNFSFEKSNVARFARVRFYKGGNEFHLLTLHFLSRLNSLVWHEQPSFFGGFLPVTVLNGCRSVLSSKRCVIVIPIFFGYQWTRIDGDDRKTRKMDITSSLSRMSKQFFFQVLSKYLEHFWQKRRDQAFNVALNISQLKWGGVRLS